MCIAQSSPWIPEVSKARMDTGPWSTLGWWKVSLALDELFPDHSGNPWKPHNIPSHTQEEILHQHPGLRDKREGQSAGCSQQFHQRGQRQKGTDSSQGSRDSLHRTTCTAGLAPSLLCSLSPLGSSPCVPCTPGPHARGTCSTLQPGEVWRQIWEAESQQELLSFWPEQQLVHSCGLPMSPQARCAGTVSSYAVATQKEEHHTFHIKFNLKISWGGLN